jgi:CheY-like chemotaxis protein
VDNNRDAADTLAMLLRLWNHDVQVAYDGETALQIAHHFRPVVALLDFQMPKMHGGQVADNLRQQNEGITIVATTASDVDDRFAEYDSSFDACLAKPCDLERLEALLVDANCFAESPSF